LVLAAANLTTPDRILETRIPEAAIPEVPIPEIQELNSIS
jgi:hypothetical protein